MAEDKKVILTVERQEQGILVKGSITQDELAQVIISLLGEVKDNTWTCVNRIYQLGRGLTKAMVDTDKKEEEDVPEQKS